MCINCQSKNVISKGIRRGIKRYFCKDCNKSFSSNRRPEQLQKIIFEEYFLHRQTLKQLSAKYKKSIPWIMKQRDEYLVECKVHNPRAVNLICDATFHGKRKDKLGTLVF
ncbi:transposase-like zinc-binding domain-containing protein [Sulfurimonas sp. NW15]|uniref:transposase-like zinc-binding domain-containing protein n=1 Tax=Sulfurimonas sp. NW15 TaxID=2922729 RepID=UPI003DA8EC98